MLARSRFDPSFFLSRLLFPPPSPFPPIRFVFVLFSVVDAASSRSPRIYKALDRVGWSRGSYVRRDRGVDRRGRRDSLDVGRGPSQQIAFSSSSSSSSFNVVGKTAMVGREVTRPDLEGWEVDVSVSEKGRW